ncbi:MAG: heme o synthase [Rubrimonas sp.]
MTFIASPAQTTAPEPELRDWLALLKPRVMSLVVFTALVGLIAAPGAVHPVVALASVLCIAIGAGASGALNQWYDADIDARMRRTLKRPVPAGRISAGEALGFGLGLSILSVAMLAVFANLLSAALLAFTIFFYAVVYTMWLKRWTPQNIVIGGAAGAFPPMIGWAVVTGDVSPEAVLMFLVILLWTPPHFWALALFASEDYRAADVPMMPVARGEAATRRQILGYSVATAFAAWALAFTTIGGIATLAAATLLNLALLRHALIVARRTAGAAKADRHAREKRLFGVSIAYLFGLFGAVALDAAVGGAPAGWPALF